MNEEAKYWIAFGDIHQSTAAAACIPGIGQAQGVIITGDLTNRSPAGAIESVWKAISRENPRILAQKGNMDRDNVTHFLKEMNANLHLEVFELAPGVKLMGVGCSVPTPFGTPGEVSEEQLAAWLDETYSRVGDYDKLVLAVHDSPYNTALDVIGNGLHVGSRSVRAFIERVQPDVSISGHIHESAGEDYIGRTKVINPGMLSGGGYVRVSVDNGRVDARLEQV